MAKARSSFTCFGFLPTEIRLMIWTAALPSSSSPREVPLVARSTATFSEDDPNEIIYSLRFINPSVSQVNHEARMAYMSTLNPGTKPVGQYLQVFQPKTDVLCVYFVQSWLDNYERHVQINGRRMYWHTALCRGLEQACQANKVERVIVNHRAIFTSRTDFKNIGSRATCTPDDDIIEAVAQADSINLLIIWNGKWCGRRANLDMLSGMPGFFERKSENRPRSNGTVFANRAFKYWKDGGSDPVLLQQAYRHALPQGELEIVMICGRCREN